MIQKTLFHRLERFWIEKEALVLLSILVLACFLRLRGISSTPTDWHAFRQSDTASVTREYVKHGLDILRPRYHDYSNIQSGKDNPSGYRMVEFPIINFVLAAILRLVPSLDLVTFSRSAALLASLGTVVALYVFVKDLSGRSTASLAALVLAILPYSVFYSRSILPEPFFLFFSTLALMSFKKWLGSLSALWYVLSLLSLALALLLKPFGVFLSPVFGVLALQRFGWKAVLCPQLYVYPILSVLPFFAWRNWILQFKEGIPDFDWLFNGNNIRLRPSWFRWSFFERLTKLILGWVGLPILFLGLWKKSADTIVYLAWGVGLLGYLIVLATGNVQHDYYQVMTTPLIAILVARGVMWLIGLKWLKNNSILQLCVVLVLLGAIYSGSWEYIGGYYRTRPDWETAGRAADALLPPTAKVIAPAFGDTAFLFQINRTGWPIGFEIEDKIAKGAEYYVSTSYDDEARMLEKTYSVLAKTADYIIIQLKPKP